MKYFVEFQLRPGNKEKLIEAFELRGPNRNPGVRLLNAWIAKSEEVVFVIAESANDDLLNKAAESWGAFGDFEITPVIDLDQY